MFLRVYRSWHSRWYHAMQSHTAPSSSQNNHKFLDGAAPRTFPWSEFEARPERHRCLLLKGLNSQRMNANPTA